MTKNLLTRIEADLKTMMAELEVAVMTREEDSDYTKLLAEQAERLQKLESYLESRLAR